MAPQIAPLGPPYPRGFPALATGAGAAALRLFIPGDPVPKGRPRTRIVTPKGGGVPYANIYTPGETVEWETHVEKWVRIQLNELARIPDGQILRLPFQKRVVMTLRFNLLKPKSYPKSVTIPVKARGDIDNLNKSVIDGLQHAGIMANDRLVTDLFSYRRYADAQHPEGVEVDVTGLG